MKNSLDIAKGQNLSVSLYNVLIPTMKFFFFYLFAMYTGGFDGPSETAYTVILRARGNEASTWRNG